MGIIFKNENTNEEMMEILKQLQSYLPKQSSNNKTKFDSQLFPVERAINVIQSVMNGYTPEDRLEGIIMQLGDWHTGLKILSVSQKYIEQMLCIQPLCLHAFSFYHI